MAKHQAFADADAAAKKVAKQLDIEPDWLNSHFDTFTGVLPADYATRLRPVFTGKYLSAEVFDDLRDREGL